MCSFISERRRDHQQDGSTSTNSNNTPPQSSPIFNETFRLIVSYENDDDDDDDDNYYLSSDNEELTVLYAENNSICPSCQYKFKKIKKKSNMERYQLIYNHLKRYHSDCYRFDEEGYDSQNKPYELKASIRTNKETLPNFKRPKRQYYHPRSRLPIEDGHHDRDCDDESTDSWFELYREERVNDFADLPDKTKTFFNLWNTFILKSKIGQQHHLIPAQIIKFVQQHAEDLVDLDMMYLRFLMILWLRRLITSDQVNKLMALYTSETERFRSKTITKIEFETTSNPTTEEETSSPGGAHSHSMISQTTTNHRNAGNAKNADCVRMTLILPII